MRKSLLVCAVALAVSSTSFAAEEADRVEITWEEPKSYTDIRPSNESRKGFRDRVFHNIEEHMEELAEDLPEGYTLKMTVTDVDLAGQVWPNRFVGVGRAAAADVRVVDRLFIPRMEFSYSLADAQGNEVKSAEVNLKDMAFQDRIVRRRHTDSFVYEKAMLSEWFDKELDALIVKN